MVLRIDLNIHRIAQHASNRSEENYFSKYQ